MKLLKREKFLTKLNTTMLDPTLIWFLIGIGLLLLELAAPGLVILFFGIGGLITSLICYLGFADSITSQLLIFSIASLASLILLRKYLKFWFVGNSKHGSDEQITEFIGKSVKVIVPIPGGPELGKIELKGAGWNAKSNQAHPVGKMVTITELEGLTVTVK